MNKQKLIALEQALCVLEAAGFEGEITFTDNDGNILKAPICAKEWKAQDEKPRGLVASILSIFGWGK
jgi:hypothetical protein